MSLWEILSWATPRILVWAVLSAYFFKKVVDLYDEDEVKNRNKIALMLFIVFFIILPLCFAF